MANKRKLKLADYGISGSRYKELCGFCEQYPEWVDELTYMNSTVGSKVITDMPVSHSGGNPQEELVMRRVELSEKTKVIEQTAIEANSELYQYIIKSVCYRKPIWYLTDIMHMPCSDRAFRDLRRYFFYLLSKNKK